jgi:ATP-dependent DNA helicase RecG
MSRTTEESFDERQSHATLRDISETKVREFLHRSRNPKVNEPDARELYRSLRITVPVNGHDAPKNIALLFFSQYPEKFFPGARIEVVQFGHDDSSTILSERIFNNRPVHEQVVDCLTYLEGFSSRWIEKNDDRPEATHWFDYPSRALREALVNAVCHRSYEDSQEPTKVYIYPNRIEIVSHPGPLPGIEMKHLEGLAPFPHVPPRNRRIGELLKELRLAEGRHTGLPTLRREMSANGSPQPLFDFDEARTYFAVTLPVHPPPG